MSNISNSNRCSSSKRRLSQIDDTIHYLTREVNTLNDFVYKTEFECSLMTVKIKREKVKALSALAKSRLLLANMNVLIAESDLFTDIERLRNFKRTKLDRNEEELQVTLAPSKTTVSVQTTECMSNKKINSRHSSSRKSPVDISSDETVLIPTIYENSASLVEASKKSPTSFFRLFNNTPTNKSDSEVSISSSFKAEFNEPYTKTQTQEPVKISPIKKQKSEKKVESKIRSKHISERSRQNVTPTGTPKTVTDLRKSVIASNHMDSSSRAVRTRNRSTDDQKSTAFATYVPLEQICVFLTQPSTSIMHPFLHESPATQDNL